MSTARSAVAGGIDTLMDRLIVPGYSRLGYAVRSRSFATDDPAPGSLAGKCALVTGANSGLGKATTAGLVALGATVVMVVRNSGRGEQALAEVVEGAVDDPSGRLTVSRCDVSDLESVRRFAAALDVGSVDVLVHNAGVLPDERAETADGNEICLATHVLGPHLLTGLLADRMSAGAPSRVIWNSSGGMYAQPLRVDDLQYREGDYRGATAYARTKRMQVVLAELWAERLRDRGVIVNATHPGWADTTGVASSLPGFHLIAGPFLRTPAEGADTVVWLAAAQAAGERTGLFWHDRRPRPTHYRAATRETDADRRVLWDECERLTS